MSDNDNGKADPNGGYVEQGEKGPQLTEQTVRAQEAIESGAARTSQQEKGQRGG